MKIKSFITGSIAVFSLIYMTACKKESESIFTMFEDVEVTFHAKDSLSVVDYKEVNDGDDVRIDYTVTSANTDMYMICVLEVGSGTPFVRQPITDSTQRRSYSGSVTIKMNKKVGETSYRVWALDKRGIYIGDGYKKITVKVKPNFSLIANKTIYLPDTNDTSLPSYFSISRAETFNSINGGARSKDIDFGIYRVPVGDAHNYRLYSLSTSPLPFTLHDISTWEKRGTLFSDPVTSSAPALFNTTIRTGTLLETEAKKRTITKKTITGITAGSVIFFLTPENKYGIILFNSITKDLQNKALMSISVKIQK